MVAGAEQTVKMYAAVWVPDKPPSSFGGPGSGWYASAGHVPGEKAEEDKSIPKGPWEKVKTADEALKALSEGRYVQLDPDQVGTVMTKMAAMVKDAEAKGKEAPKYNLCNISVPGTNVFCGGGGATHPRIEMPRIPNKDRKGFEDYLRSKGIPFQKDEVRVDKLKASQTEIDGAKVAQNIQIAREGGKNPLDSRIFVSKDNFIIDGHHKWAAAVGLKYTEGQNFKMKVVRVDLPVTVLYHVANMYTDKMGYQRLGHGESSYKKATEPYQFYGTASSGNYGHLGRPGEVGGSGEGGEKSQEYWDQAKLVGPQGGSVPGGKFQGPDGKQYYVKWYKNPDQARSEIFAQKVYNTLGIKTPQGQIATVDGKQGIATPWIQNAGSYKDNVQGLHDALEHNPEQAMKLFVGSVATQNWDVVGTGADNIVYDVKNSQLVPIDNGGSYLFRAQGGAKAWNENATEVNTLLDPNKNYYAAAAFKGILDKPENLLLGMHYAATLIKNSEELHGPGTTKAQFEAKIKDMNEKFNDMYKIALDKEAASKEDIYAKAGFPPYDDTNAVMGTMAPEDKELIDKLSNTYQGDPNWDPFQNNSATSVIRWMGANGYKSGDVQKVFDAYGKTISPATIKTQLYAGKTGKGDLANLNEGHISLVAQITGTKSLYEGGGKSTPPPEPPVIPKNPFENTAHSNTAIIRYFGKEGFSVKQAQDYFAQHGAKIADSTLKIQLAAGKNGTRGAPANISKEERAHIEATIGKPAGTPSATAGQTVSAYLGSKTPLPPDTKASVTVDGKDGNAKLDKHTDNASSYYQQVMQSHLIQQAKVNPALKSQLIQISMNKAGTIYAEDKRIEYGAKKVAHDIQSSWGGSSTDHNYTSLGLQVAVANKFGLPTTIKGGGQGNGTYAAKMGYKEWGIKSNGPSATILDVAKEIGKSPAFVAFADKTYQMTQENLAKQGIKEVTLYRSMTSSGGVPNVSHEYLPAKAVLNPISSFSTQMHSFGQYKFTLTAPASRIFSHANTGPGTNYENEVVVIGGKVSTLIKKGGYGGY